MCGFFVYLSHADTQVDVELLHRATTTLEHRGPDDYGYAYIGCNGAYRWKETPPAISMRGGVAMGHRRLSILDLSEQGRQPFSSRDETLWVVYNGEIYNYVELRQELAKLGYSFRTGTDTEVVLASYQHWGADCFSHFNGMWAIAIWDQKQHSLILSRDRFGIKPLSFTRIGGDWMFASEKKALLAHPKLNSAPNSNSVLRYLSRKSAPVLGESFYQSIEEVKPGTVMQVSDGRIKEHRYWDLPSRSLDQEKDLPAAADKLSSLLSDAVKLRLRSDVKVGTMVSGGLDSTSVIQKMVEQKALPDMKLCAMGESLQGFHAAFPDLPIDEVERVNDLSVMMEVHTNNVFPAKADNIADIMLAVSRHMEAPFFNSVPIVHSLLMKCAKERGVKVILNGHGADEIFAGYPSYYHPLAASGFVQRGELFRAARQVSSMASILNIPKVSAWLRVAEEVVPYRLQFWRAAKNKGEAGAGLFNFAAARQLRDTLPDGASQLDRALRRDLFQTILPNWLNMEDRISMSQSIEARLPFLDYRVVEYAFSLADHLKIQDGETKRVLRHAMKGKLPASILKEKQKFYFSGPDSIWLRGALRQLLSQYLLDEEPYVSRFLNVPVLREVVSDFLQGDERFASRIWNIFSTECWLRSV